MLFSCAWRCFVFCSFSLTVLALDILMDSMLRRVSILGNLAYVMQPVQFIGANWWSECVSTAF